MGNSVDMFIKRFIDGHTSIFYIVVTNPGIFFVTYTNKFTFSWVKCHKPCVDQPIFEACLNLVVESYGLVLS